MSSATWRGTIGVIKPTYASGSLVEFIRLLPSGLGVIPVYIGLSEHTQREYLDALEIYQVRVAELAKVGVDLIHPEGAPPFLMRGYKAEQEIVKTWEEKYQLPIVTSGMTQAEALRAMKIKRFLGVTYYNNKSFNDMFARYFTESGFDVAAMEGMPVEKAQWQNISAEEIYSHIKKFFLKHSDVDGIYLLGSGAWQVSDIIPLERDLGVPIIHPVAARVWSIQRRMHIRQPVQGAGMLLEQMP